MTDSPETPRPRAEDLPPESFGAALASGAELLRSLPRRRSGVAGARRAADAWAARHPDAHAQLVVDQRPGSPVVDYDLLLDHPDGGTIALSAPPEDGVPWLIDHSTHWAAGHLVSVDGVHVSVPQALTMLRSLSGRDASPYQEIVDQCLLAAAGDDGSPVGAADLQATADAFRRGRGLRDRASTLAWMAAAGMSGEQFEAYIEGIARRRRFRKEKEAELAPGHLAANPGDFARVRAVWVTGGEKVVVGDVAELFGALGSAGGPGAAGGLGSADVPGSVGGCGPVGDVVVTVGVRWESDLPEALRGAPPGQVIGPEKAPGGGFLTGAVLSRTPAVADAATLEAAGRAAFAAWLAERRAAATVEWHWS
ncbi:TIGR04500 family putative peptide maturation system protein [Nonomuraea rhodomycinica]|uniref:TIGR04500 family putative peptide maturation system protein n=1 Tax=Nonomuraea rhodomycinica TaxID=1712872 RepID=A0A7Y6IJY7_9ACTN|nr:TIGR04500 family putative peptide maturation system protein [Nonomuraea rhodomycinica]NUW39667.1 TIGR04500 family putative peptide maturation system protein [Nonomuraea rhodomycinica]